MPQVSTPPTIYPALRYKDAHAAIRFITDAFGFKEHAVHEGPDGTVAHAELAWGSGMDYGSRGYTARDTEGNLWSFGTYQPIA
jgi:uncharacterized glyoxalase superfamily protein PhnB